MSCKKIICNGVIQYVEPNKRKEVIKEMHSSALGGHKGVSKTFSRIRHRYCWENMKSDIQQFIRNCLECQLKKLVRVKNRNPMIITDTPGAAFDKVAMDIVSPLPKPKNDNEYILTIQDQLTKYSLAIGLQNATATTISNALVRRFICTFGAPRSVLTDQGSNFLSKVMKNLAKRFKIQRYKTTAFHPQSNGSIERSHHVLGEYLKQFANQDQEWDDWLELATFSYNTSFHEGTRHTPFELVFGRLARLPSNDPLEPEKESTYDEYLIKLVTRLHELQTLARDNLISAKLKSKQIYDRKIKPQTLKIGDFVFLLKGPKPGKLEDHYTGPHEVLEISPNGNVKILIKKKPRGININRLKYSYMNQN